MAVSDAHVFPGFLTTVIIQLFFPKLPTTFLTCFYRGERRKYTRKKFHLNRGSNSQPPGHESDMLTTEPPGWGLNSCPAHNFQTVNTINLKLQTVIEHIVQCTRTITLSLLFPDLLPLFYQ